MLMVKIRHNFRGLVIPGDSPKNHPFEIGVFHDKPSILGYLHFTFIHVLYSYRGFQASKVVQDFATIVFQYTVDVFRNWNAIEKNGIS